jgi:mannosyltransferase
MTDLPRAHSARGSDDPSLTAGDNAAPQASDRPDEPDHSPAASSPDELDAAITRATQVFGDPADANANANARTDASASPSAHENPASAPSPADDSPATAETPTAAHRDGTSGAPAVAGVTAPAAAAQRARPTRSAVETTSPETASPGASSVGTPAAETSSAETSSAHAPSAHAPSAETSSAATSTKTPRRPSKRSPAAPGRGRRLRDAILVGLAGLIVSGAFLWVPSVWYDEAATVTSATRSFGQLWQMVQTVDAVHAAYYSLMHLWFDLVGYSPLTLRLPSAICIGLSSGFIVWLGGRLVTHRIAVVAGILFFLMPRVAWMGTEGRSFALTTLIAITLTLVLVYAVRSRRRIWPWVAYVILAVGGVAVFAYLALLLAAHGATMVWWALTRLRGKARAANTARVFGSFLVAAGIAAAGALPLVLAIRAQAKQVSWIAPISDATRGQIFTTQFFTENPVLAWIGWPLGAVGVVILAWGGWVRFRSPAKPGGIAGGGLTLLQVAVPWLLVPLSGLVVASEIFSPLYSPRYLAFTAPALALLMAVPIVAVLRKKWQIAVAVTVIAAVAAPSIVSQRLPEAKDNSAWSQVADLIARERAAETVGTKDAVIFGPVRRHPTATSRVIEVAYPDAFAGMTDINLDTPGALRGTLWESIYPLSERLDVANEADVIYLITSNKRDWRGGVAARLEPLGFSITEQWKLTGVNVLRFERVPTDDGDAPTRGAPPEDYVDPSLTTPPTDPFGMPTPLPGEPGSTSAPTVPVATPAP